MKSIPLESVLLGVLLVRIAGGAEAVDDSHEGNAQIADFDDFEQVRTGIFKIDGDASTPGSMFLSNAPGFTKPESTDENGGISYALSSGYSEPKDQDKDWSTTTVDASADDRVAVGLAANTLHLPYADPSNPPSIFAADEELTSSNAQLVPGRLAAGETQFVLASTNAGSAGSGSVSMQAGSSAALFALQSTIGSWTEQYEYDALGRLTKVTFANGAVRNYTLDNAGNRTNVSTTVP